MKDSASSEARSIEAYFKMRQKETEMLESLILLKLLYNKRDNEFEKLVLQYKAHMALTR